MIADQWCTPTNIPGVFQKAFLFFRHMLPLIMKITLIILVPVQLISLAAGFMAESTGALAMIGWTIIIIATFGGQLWLTAALIHFTLKFCITEEINPLDQTLKSASRFVTPLLGLYSMLILFIFGISLLLSMIMLFFAGNASAETVQSLQIFSFFMAFFALYPRFFMAPFILIDEPVRIGDALRKSTQLFNVNRAKALAVFFGFILLNVVVFLLNFVSPILSFISVIFFVPYTLFIQAFLFIDLKIESGEFVLEQPEETSAD